MPRFNIAGFGGVKSTLTPVPPGDYKVQIVKCEEKVGKEKGTKYLNWVLSVVDHPEFSGRYLYFMTMLEPKEALFRLKKLCEAVGCGFDDSGVETDEIIGQYLVAKVVHVTNKDTNEPRHEVVTVNACAEG